MTKAMTNQSNNRVLWIDFFRTLAILLVVIGHITPNYNKYIYQFHMAAFFWISGYCSNWDNGSKSRTVWKRFCSLILPLISIFIFGTILMSTLYKMGIYSLLYSPEYPWIGCVNALKAWLLQGNNYIWWMGASWFLSVLFGITVVHMLLLSLEAMLPKIKYLYLLLCIIIYIAGIYCAQTGINTRNIDLIMIGQFYYGLGILYKKNEFKVENKTYSKTIFPILILLICNVIFGVLLGNIPFITVDYPSRIFHYYFLSICSSINGICFLICLSKLLSYLFKKKNCIKKVITYIAQHTIAIVFFHFLMFKLCILGLIALKIVPLEYLQSITPAADDIGQKYLFCFLCVSVMGSIILWKLITLFPGMKFCLGVDKETYIKIWNASFFCAIKKFIRNLIRDLKKWLEEIFSEIYGENKFLSYSIGFGFIMLSVLIIQEGIILNDELNFTLIRQNGYISLLISILKNELRMGRPLRLIGGINWSLAFLTNNVYINRFIQCLFIGVCIIQFARVINHLFKSKGLAAITIILIITCMPLTFEHSAPNAFISLVMLPLWHLNISFNNWIAYLRTGRKKYFWWYLATWIIALQGYEFVVSYTPVFILIYLFDKKGQQSLKETVHKCLPPVTVGILYILATVLLGKIIDSQYSGTILTFVSAESSFKIVKMLALSAIPGYFLFNNKYLYLFYLYSGGCIEDIYNAISNHNIDSLIKDASCIMELRKLVLNIWLTPANIIKMIVLVSMIICMWRLSQAPQTKPSISIKFNIKILFCLIGYILIPSIPNSLSSLYQGTVSAVSFTSLPVSMFLFFTACLLIGYITCIIWTKWKGMAYVLCVLFFILSFSIQTMNIVFANKHSQNFKRIVMIEKLFQCDCIRNLDGATIYAPDLFETKDALAVSNDFWEQIALNNELSLHFTKDENASVKIFFINDEYFCIVTDTEVAILSPYVKSDVFLVSTNVDSFVPVKSNIWQCDGQLACCHFENKGGDLIVLDAQTEAFHNYQAVVGDTMETANISGRYDDGWCERNVRIRIDSGADGKLCFSGWFPESIDQDAEYAISVYCNENLVQTYSLEHQEINIVLNVSPNEIVTVDLKSNFSINNTNGDLRELSYILNDIQ